MRLAPHPKTLESPDEQQFLQMPGRDGLFSMTLPVKFVCKNHLASKANLTWNMMSLKVAQSLEKYFNQINLVLLFC